MPPPKTLRDSKYWLLHLSNISLVPSDIVSVQWKITQAFSKKVVTKIRTRFEVFILEANSPRYEEDVEALKKATKKLNL